MRRTLAPRALPTRIGRGAGLGLALIAILATCCSRTATSEPRLLPPVDYATFVALLPEVQNATLLVIVHGPWLSRPGAKEDDLGPVELAFWPSGYVVWAESTEDGSSRHRGAQLSPEVTERALSRAALAIDRHGGLRELPVDSGSEEVWIRRNDATRGVALWSVFAERDAPWNGRLPGVGYPGNTPDDPERYTLEEILELENERYPVEVELYRAWHAVKEEVRAALPKDGELVDRAKLATLGLR